MEKIALEGQSDKREDSKVIGWRVRRDLGRCPPQGLRAKEEVESIIWKMCHFV